MHMPRGEYLPTIAPEEAQNDAPPEHAGGPDHAVREFSREHAPEERQRVAEEILQRRAEYFSRKQQLDKRIHELERHVRDKERSAAETVAVVRSIEAELNEQKRSKIAELLHFFSIRKLESTREMTQEQLEGVLDERDAMAETLNDLEVQRFQRTELEEARALLQDFYHGQQEAWEAYEADQRARDVSRVLQEENVTFVHGIHPNFIPEKNSLLERWVDWKTKLRILISCAPSISTSTLREGDTPANMWARMGVLVTGGSVREARSQDAGTKARGVKERTETPVYKGFEDEDPVVRIREAIKNRQRGNINELTVEEPAFAGLYYCRDEQEHTIQNDRVPESEMIVTAEELGMSIFLVEQGVPYRTTIDPETKQLVRGERVDPATLATERFSMDERKRETILRELMEDSPFRLETTEIHALDSRSRGRELYIELADRAVLDKNAGPETPYSADEDYYGSRIPNGTPVRTIATLQERGKTIEYILAPKGVARTENMRGKQEQRVDYVDVKLLYGAGRIRLGSGLTHPCERPIASIDDYVMGMDESVAKALAEREVAVAKGAHELTKRHFDGWLEELAYHLHGFAEQAAAFGDTETQKRAIAIAERITPEAVYRETVARRLTPDGKLKITAEDIGLKNK